MSAEGKNSKQKVAIWRILTVFVGVAAIIVTVVIWRRPIRERDFTLSVTPMRGTIQQGGVTETTIYVKGEGGYKHPVSLSATGNPFDVVIAFSPPFGAATPAYNSTMTVNVGPKVQPGDCAVIIKGTGADGKEHSCTYTLTITKRDVVYETLPEIKITSPKTREEVPISITVRGTFSGELPEGQYMRVVLNPHPSPGLWWPQVGKYQTLEWAMECTGLVGQRGRG